MIAVALAGGLLAAAAAVLSGADRRRRTRALERGCHELRGPLCAIGLGLELAGRLGALSPARLRALELELGRATRALDDLAGAQWRGEPDAPIEVATLLADSVEAWRPFAAGHGVRLQLGRLDPAIVDGSRVRLAQATGNLIANAIEHGAGPVVVGARRGPEQVRIEVCDAGPGLPGSLASLERRRRFGWLVRAGLGRLGPPPARRGRGHGLAIVAEVARAHHGRLAAAPTEAGARLVIELPLGADPPASLRA